MMSQHKILVIALLLGLVAGGLRFYRLGTYPFAGDETATLDETSSLFQERTGPQNDQRYRLPRLIPLAYAVHWLDYELFGRDEFGSRVLMAVIGAATVSLIFLGLASTLHWRVALTTAMLLALWPEHIIQSQQNRFYITAALFSASCMLAGARAVQLRSTLWTFVACMAAFAAILTHTLQVLLFPGLFLAILIAFRGEHQRLPKQLLVTVVACGLAAGAVLMMVFWETGQGWNARQTWGYSPLRSLLASVNQVGWPMFLLAGLGIVCLLRQAPGQGYYWGTWAAVWLLASGVLPLLVVYHASYVFPYAISVIVIAGYAVIYIAQLLRPAGSGLSLVWVVVALSLQLPSLVSHYQDGSRHDHRTAARFIAKHWRPGDRLAAVSTGLVKHYAKLDGPTLSLSDGQVLKDLQRTVVASGRTWVVIPSGRQGIPEDLRLWLGLHCQQQLVVKRPRFDYYDFVVEVFLHTPDADTLAAR